MLTAHNAKSFGKYTLFVNPDDMSIYRAQQVTLKSYLWKGKMLWFNCSQNPVNDVYWYVKTYGCNSSTRPYLYICPECSISRDSIRNSGYKIVRDKEKASLVVIPVPEFACKLSYDMAIIHEDANEKQDVYLFNIDVKDFISWNNSAIDLLQENLRKFLGFKDDATLKFSYLFSNDKLNQCNMFSTNRCAEYVNLVDQVSTSLRSETNEYCFENKLTLTPSIEINPELFKVWDHCDDRQVLQDSIVQCDWQKYPITLAFYLANFKATVYYCGSKALENILKEIGFYYLRDNGVVHKLVQPEDWNMLQKCMLAKLNLPETGGYIKTDSGGSTRIFSSRVAVKPLYIDKPAYYDDLMQMIKTM